MQGMTLGQFGGYATAQAMARLCVVLVSADAVHWGRPPLGRLCLHCSSALEKGQRICLRIHVNALVLAMNLSFIGLKQLNV